MIVTNKKKLRSRPKHCGAQQQTKTLLLIYYVMLYGKSKKD